MNRIESNIVTTRTSRASEASSSLALPKSVRRFSLASPARHHFALPSNTWSMIPYSTASHGLKYLGRLMSFSISTFY